MRGLWRDRDFLLVGGCLLVGVLQIRAQRRLLRALDEAHGEQASRTRPAWREAAHRTHQPMCFTHPVLQAELEQAELGNAYGMN